MADTKPVVVGNRRMASKSDGFEVVFDGFENVVAHGGGAVAVVAVCVVVGFDHGFGRGRGVPRPYG